MPDAFEQFWALYPRRVGKLDALKAWMKLNPSEEVVAEIMAALAWQFTSWDDAQFIPYPASWLRAGRWMDEPTPKAAFATQNDFENWRRKQRG